MFTPVVVNLLIACGALMGWIIPFLTCGSRVNLVERVTSWYWSLQYRRYCAARNKAYRLTAHMSPQDIIDAWKYAHGATQDKWRYPKNTLPVRDYEVATIDSPSTLRQIAHCRRKDRRFQLRLKLRVMVLKYFSWLGF